MSGYPEWCRNCQFVGATYSVGQDYGSRTMVYCEHPKQPRGLVDIDYRCPNYAERLTLDAEREEYRRQHEESRKHLHNEWLKTSEGQLYQMRAEAALAAYHQQEALEKIAAGKQGAAEIARDALKKT